MKKTMAEQIKEAREGLNPVGYCGHHCDFCGFKNRCGGCRSSLNRCSYATLYPDNQCPNVKCANEKGLTGCYECEELKDCKKGYYEKENNNEFTAKATALFIKEYGEECYTQILKKAKKEGIRYTGDFDESGSVENALELLKEIKEGKAVQINQEDQTYEVYHVVRRYKDRIVEVPDIEDFTVDTSFLNDISLEDLYSGFCDFQQIIEDIHTDLMNSPDEYALSCIREEHLAPTDPFSETESKALKSYERYGFVFKAFAILGERSSDSLVIDCDEISKYKISKLNIILKHLNEYGFIFTGVSDEFSIPKKGEFMLSYPDNINVLYFIKAFESVNEKNLDKVFLRADWRVLKHSDIKLFEYDMSDMIRGLNDFDKVVIMECTKILTDAGYQSIVTETGGYQINYSHKKDKKGFIYFKRQRDSLQCRLKLEEQPQSYLVISSEDELNSLLSLIKSRVKN